MPGGGGSGGTQTQVASTQLPDWVNSAAQQTWGTANSLIPNLMGPYTGERVAPMNAGQMQDIAAGQANVGATQPAFDNAMGATNALMGYQTPQVNPQTLASTNLAPYMNPYMSAVINPTLQLMDTQRQQQLNQVGQQAVQAGAFGGSRQGIQEGVTNAATNMQMGQFAANLMNQNFGQAQTAATGDITRNMTAQQANQQANLYGAQFQGNMANQYANLATQGNQNFLNQLQYAMTGQGQLQQQAQAQDTAAQQAYAEQQQYQLEPLQIMTNTLAGLPYGKTTTTTGPGPSFDTTGQWLGLGAAGIGAAGTIGAAVVM